jgi:hypothetical protein
VQLLFFPLDVIVQVIDATPTLFCRHDAPDLVFKSYGSQSMRFIVILRNPVERAMSIYRMRITNSKQPDPDQVWRCNISV